MIDENNYDNFSELCPLVSISVSLKLASIKILIDGKLMVIKFNSNL